MAVKTRRRSNSKVKQKKNIARTNIVKDFERRTRAQREGQIEKLQKDIDQKWKDVDRLVKRKSKDESTSILYKKYTIRENSNPIEKETNKERLLKDHLDKDLTNNLIPKIIKGYNGKFEAKVDEILSRKISQRVLNKVKVVHRKVLLKDFKVHDILHGELKSWSMIYNSYDLRNVLKIKDHYFLFEKVKYVK